MNIGIITEFGMHNVNYGNNLQAYALSKLLKQMYPYANIDILYFEKYKIKRLFYVASAVRRAYYKIYRLFDKKKETSIIKLLQKRLISFNRFRNDKANFQYREMNWESLLKSDYDVFIVGSDVVWSQDAFSINRVKFLDFVNTANAKKVSYAASFGRDWIPFSNRPYIRKCLKKFQGISA